MIAVLLSLWLPVLVSSVAVFVVSSVIHMVLGYHKGDWKAVPQEDAVQEALRPFGLPPGDYMLPRPSSMAQMNSPEFKAKLHKGPVLVMTTWVPSPGMGLSLGLWFLYSVVVGVFCGYVAGLALPVGASYLGVFRIVGPVGVAGYSLALAQHSIWYHRNWGTTMLSMFDGFVYALLTAGIFGWLWPR
jgi:hypothetical protein